MSKRRRLLKFLVIAFLTGIFLFTAASVAVRLAFNPRRLEQEIRSQIFDATGREAGLTQASVSLTRGIVIKGFYLLDQEPSDLESVSFGRAIIDVGLFSLLRGNPKVRSIDLSQPHIDFIFDASGNSNLSDLFDALWGGGEDSASDDGEESDGGSDSRSDSQEGGDDARVIERLRVRGGSISIIRQSIEEQFDRYLDITGLTLEIENFNTDTPFPIHAVGSLGVERQTTFTIDGVLDPTTLAFDGQLEILEVRHELANSLLNFTRDVEGWRLRDGELQELSLAISTGPDFDPIEIEGDMESDDIAVSMGGPVLAFSGDIDLAGSIGRRSGDLVISDFTLENARRGDDGEFQVTGEMNWKEGTGDLRMDLVGISPANFPRFFPLPVKISDPATWLDATVRLSLDQAFQQGRISGDLRARQLSMAVPGLSRDQMDLDGLTVEGTMTYDLASEEWGFDRTVWSLPGLISSDDPLAVVGSSANGLGVVMPALDWEAVMARVSSAEIAPSRSDSLVNLARLLGLGGEGVPISVALPAIDGGSWRWDNVESSFRAEIGGLVVEDFQATIPGGQIQLSGALGERGRFGQASIEGMDINQFSNLCGVNFTNFSAGTVTGDIGGDIVDGSANLAALDIAIEDLTIDQDWILDELAVFTGLDELRRWQESDGILLVARNGEGWRVADVSLESDSLGLNLMGHIALNGDVLLLATVAVPPATIQQFAADPLIGNAPIGSDGWAEIQIMIEGPRRRTSLSEATAEDRARVLAALAPTRAVEIFEELGLTPSDDLVAMVELEVEIPVEEPEEEPPAPSVPPLESPMDSGNLPPIEPLTQPAALDDLPQLPDDLGSGYVSPEPEPEPQLPPAPIPSERAPEIED